MHTSCNLFRSPFMGKLPLHIWYMVSAIRAGSIIKRVVQRQIRARREWHYEINFVVLMVLFLKMAPKMACISENEAFACRGCMPVTLWYLQIYFCVHLVCSRIGCEETVFVIQWPRLDIRRVRRFLISLFT